MSNYPYEIVRRLENLTVPDWITHAHSNIKNILSEMIKKRANTLVQILEMHVKTQQRNTEDIILFSPTDTVHVHYLIHSLSVRTFAHRSHFLANVLRVTYNSSFSF